MDSDSFDIINYAYVLHEMPAVNAINIINEIYRLLKPGGSMTGFEVPFPDSLIEFVHNGDRCKQRAATTDAGMRGAGAGLWGRIEGLARARACVRALHEGQASMGYILRVVRSPNLAAALKAAPPVVSTGAIKWWHVLIPSMKRAGNQKAPLHGLGLE